MKVLLVDDEPLTTESLERYIDWQGLGITSVKTAANGMEALAILDHYMPDIVVSDVRMPRMNGIEFATRARENHPDIKLIFLSGYSDKEYLKSAIHLKAINYVEKPVKLEELTAAIRESVSQRTTELANQTLTRSVIHQRIVGKLMKETLSIDDLKQEFGDHVPHFFNKSVRSMAIQLSLHSQENTSNIDNLKMEITYTVDQLTEQYKERFIANTNNDILIVLIKMDLLSTSEFKETARKILYSLSQSFGNTLAITIGIGKPNSIQEGINKACLSSIAAVKSLFYFGVGLVYSEPPSEAHSNYTAVVEQIYSDFRHTLRSDREPEAISLVDELTLHMRTVRDPDTGRVKNIYFRLLMVLHEFALEKGLSVTDPQQEEKFIWMEVAEISTLETLHEYVIGNVQAVFSQFKEHTAVNSRVSSVVQYIKLHYGDKELTTRVIADNTYLSQNYMCALFKRETSKTINEYITEIRLERAKELLKDRQLKLYEVALLIGFTDPNYFSSMFKKAVGLTPSQYRERL